jgi:signal transduction histidine kinase/ActR/RegA family two-component response regulator
MSAPTLVEFQAALQDSERRYRSLVDRLLDGFARCDATCDPDGQPIDFQVVEVNPAFERITGLSAEALVGRTLREAFPELASDWSEDLGLVALGGEPLQLADHCSLGKRLDLTAYSPQRLQLAVLVRDVTEPQRAKEERAKLEQQLRHSQRMEAVGRLAAGVAHDFNNLLSPILAYSELLIMELAPGDPRHEELEQIRHAAVRARDLTRQLLSFGRKQLGELTPVDLREVVRGLEKLLRRTVREDVRIELRQAAEAQPVRVDVGQIEQVIMHLAVNAQEAMPGGGLLVLEVREAPSLPDAAGTHPGRQILLSVGDTGADAETAGQLCDPLFTAKEKEAGAGLGISAACAIVHAHGGTISIRSLPGKGTTYEICLPRHLPPAEQPASPGEASGLPRGAETILVVEDDEAVRATTHRMLERQGYRVIAAQGEDDCFEAARDRSRRIDLLVTDVVMPGIHGKELYDQLAALQPGLQVLYMSGHTQSIIAHHGVLEPGACFIQKPFSVASLAGKVREALDRNQESGVGSPGIPAPRTVSG